MEASSIRGAFTAFFERHDHLQVASAPLVAPGDPTLLFTSAGMVPLKPFFLGQETPPRERLTSVQKCFRTTDMDAVGDDSHLTFFEMMGNFSLGDYFKAEAQAWAWELVTQGLAIPAERLVTTVFLDDDEAFDNWRRIGVPEERIFRYGEEEGNYWSAGVGGPCGPCSEIHYDMHPDPSGAHPGPAGHEERYLEIWNLVFMQFRQNEDGSKTPLPAANIDTGAGLERWAMMLQGKSNLYETDLFLPLLQYVAGRSGRDYQGGSEAERRALRVIVEHGRAVTFLVSDGVLPSNEGRGYVLRRLIRRALYMAQTLGIQEQLLADVAEQVRAHMGEAYPEIVEHKALTDRVLDQEEERFRQTLASGHAQLEAEIIPAIKGRAATRPSPTGEDSTARKAGPRGEQAARTGSAIARKLEQISAKQARSGASVEPHVPGEIAFLLYDTYGFPPELTREIAAEHGLEFDQAGFDVAMAEQRERGRAASEFRTDEDAALFTRVGGVSEFLGYEGVQGSGTVTGIVLEGALVDAAVAGGDVEVVLDQTPFYPEGGGQVGDAGRLVGPAGEVEVRDTQRRGDLISHVGAVVRGRLAVGDVVEAAVEGERRGDVMRNHTATHLLHAALRGVLGEHVRQAGSLVAADRLRFDYTQAEAPAAEQLAAVQRLVSGKIREDIGVDANVMSYHEAIDYGAMAIFGEKYGTDVRVIEICDPDPAVRDCFSKELCGGTHAPATGFIGEFQIVSEGSVGAGVRRIEALTGAAAEAWRQERLTLLDDVAAALRTAPLESAERVRALQGELSAAKRRLAELERKAGAGSAATVAAAANDVDGVAVAAGRVEVASAEALRQAGDEVRRRLGSGVIVLGAVAGKRPLFVAMVTDDLVQRGLHAGKLIREVATITGGGGGGGAEMAQAGGKDETKLEEALATVPEIVRRQGAG